MAVVTQPLINGEAMSWASITVNLFGVPVPGITAISYKDEQEIEDNWGAGNYPVSRGFGPVKAEGSITLLAEEDELLIDKAPEGRLQNIPEFDVVIAYIRQGTNRVITHTLKNCRFMGNSRDVKQGDKKIEVEHTLIVSHINWK